MFDAIRYFRDRRIEFRTESGWANIPCPLCRSEVYGSVPNKPYLGYNLTDGYFHCWRCKGHSVEDVVMALERCQWHEACAIVQEYEADFEYRPPPGVQKQAQGLQGTLDWPGGTLPMQPYHRQYLVNRGFDPAHLETKYRLMGTINAGTYAGRVMIPIFWQGRMVSYQGRLIVRGEPKYKACPKDQELIAHEDILYNYDNAGDMAIVVEGVFDVWRLGDGAVATFGTSMDRSSPQLMLLLRFKKVFIMFDAEPPAQRKARWLRDQLSAMGVEAMNVVLPNGDPGSMDQNSANELKRRLLK